MNNTEIEHWGYHLLVQAKKLNEKMNEPSAIKQFLETTVHNIKMTPLSEPMVVYASSEKDGSGYSAFMFLTTSHISAHFDTNGNTCYFDVFSCKIFDPDIVLNIFNECFAPENIDHMWLSRSTDPYPYISEED